MIISLYYIFSEYSEETDTLSEDSEESEETSEAREAFDRGDFKLALDLCTQEMDSSPANAASYNGRALILFKLGRNTGMYPQPSSISCAEKEEGIGLEKL